MSTFVLFYLAAAPVLPVESPDAGAWLSARCDVDTAPGGGVLIRYDFEKNRRGCWARRAFESQQDLRGFKYLRARVDSDQSGIELRPYLILLDDGRERAFSTPSIRVDWAGDRLFSIELRMMALAAAEISDDELGRVRQLNLAVEPGKSARGEVCIRDIAFIVEPEGEIIGRKPSDARFASDEAFLDAIDWPDGLERRVEGFGAYLKRRTAPTFFFDGRDSAALADELRRRYVSWLPAKKRDADDRVMRRNFLFEGDERQLADPIEWNQGPVEWSNILNRLQYLESLYAAYWDTRDEIYARDCLKILDDWIVHNPPPEFLAGPGAPSGNAWRSLETGVRCDTMSRAFYALLGSPSVAPADCARLARTLAEHARYLKRFQEDFGYRPGNFQVVECAGLAMIGILFPEFKEAAVWRETAFDVLYEHMRKDVYEDGTHWEVTPGYHGWVAERFSTVWQLARRNGIPVEPWFTERLRQMYYFDLKVISPTGHSPMNGDCGRYNLRDRLAIGAYLFNDPVLRFAASDSPPLNLFLQFGPDGLARYAALSKEVPPFASVLLPDSGYGIMRSGWGANDAWFFFDMVPYGGGHSHPDQLSFEFQWESVLLFGDSGRLNYNHPIHREYLRSPRAHNVCSVDGVFANVKESPDRLEWRDDARFLVARARIPLGDVTWERGVLWVKPDLWILRDAFQGAGRHDIERYFNHAPAYPENAPDSAERERVGLPTVESCLFVPDGEARTEKGYFGVSASEVYDADTTVVRNALEMPGFLWCVLTPPGTDLTIRAETASPNVLDLAVKGHAVARIVWSHTAGLAPNSVQIDP